MLVWTQKSKKWSSAKYQSLRVRGQPSSWKWNNFEFDKSFAILGGGMYAYDKGDGSSWNVDVVLDNGTVVPGFEDLKYPVQ